MFGMAILLCLACQCLLTLTKAHFLNAKHAVMRSHEFQCCMMSLMSEVNDAVCCEQLLTRRVTATEERACHLCHARLGTQVFAAYPNGVLVCFKCYRHSKPTVCPVTGTDFAHAQVNAAAKPENWPD